MWNWVCFPQWVLRMLSVCFAWDAKNRVSPVDGKWRSVLLQLAIRSVRYSISDLIWWTWKLQIHRRPILRKCFVNILVFVFNVFFEQLSWHSFTSWNASDELHVSSLQNSFQINEWNYYSSSTRGSVIFVQGLNYNIICSVCLFIMFFERSSPWSRLSVLTSSILQGRLNILSLHSLV